MAAGRFKVLAAATLIMAVVMGCIVQTRPPVQSDGSDATARVEQQSPTPAQSDGGGVTAQAEQPKQRVAVLPSVGDLDPQRLILLTDKVREIATKNLPRDNFNILKQDKIIEMIGEEELYRSCKEGVCIGDLAKKTNANYGARCDVIKLDNSLVMKFELYSVNEESIFETFTDYNVNDFHGMLSSLEARLPDVFKEMVSVSKSREVTPKPEPAKPKPPAPPPQTVQQTARNVETGTTFTDSRDGKVYKKVAIGGQVWMGENLNYNVEGSKCYKNDSTNCEKYGRLYDWSTAKGACPAGWHLASDAEWKTLVDYAGGSRTAGTKLKSSTGWKSSKKSTNGTDDYEFSALPGGSGFSVGSFSYAGKYGFWWSATGGTANGAWSRDIYYYGEGVGRNRNYKSYLFSVRCVAD